MSAAGRSAWIPLNRLQNNFNVGLAVVLSSGASLVYTVQHTFDDLYAFASGKSISRTTTTATVTYTNHGLSSGDWANVQDTGDSNLDGLFTVTYINANSFSYTVSNTGVTAAPAKVAIARVLPNITLDGLTVNADGNYINPVTACRLYVSTYVSGFADLLVQQGFGT